jgi:hypothetical protein
MSENKPNNNNKKNKEIDPIGPEEKVCYNCKHFLWMVGVGMGARCSINRENGLPKMLPSRRYTCDLFENKN